MPFDEPRVSDLAVPGRGPTTGRHAGSVCPYSGASSETVQPLPAAPVGFETELPM
jgi:hypothetical protein